MDDKAHAALVVGAVEPEAWGRVTHHLLPGAWCCGLGVDPLEARRHGLAVRDSLFIATPAGPLVAWLLRAPLSEPTLARQVLATGTGGINIDGCRIAHGSPADLEAHKKSVEAIKAKGGVRDGSWKNSSDLSGANEVTTSGRWPANFILVHHQGCVSTGTRQVKGRVINRWQDGAKPFGGGAGHAYRSTGEIPEEVWVCHEGCPSAELGTQSGLRKAGAPVPTGIRKGVAYGALSTRKQETVSYGDEGTASRFFFQGKDFQEVLDYLTKLILPEGGALLTVGVPQ